jgi:hypothetical protein
MGDILNEVVLRMNSHEKVLIRSLSHWQFPDYYERGGLEFRIQELEV